MNLPPADLQRLLAEEPFVRRLAHSLLADEADDVVQEAWVRAIEAQPAGVRDARSWLARIVQHLAIDSRRRRVRRRAREAALPAATLVPSSAELAITEERRRALVAAVDALPEHLRTVVLLRWFAGMPPRRIAGELGVPAPVVWNRLHAALTALRARLDAEHGGERRAWLVPLVPFAVAPRELPWRELTVPAAAMPLATGAIMMTSKAKGFVGVALVAMLALTWMLWPPAVLVPIGTEPAGAPSAALTAAVAQPSAEPAPAAVREPAQDAVASEALATGSLEVVVLYPSEPLAAADALVLVVPAAGDFRVDAMRQVTDRDGRACFANLRPGEYRVRAIGRANGGTRVVVASGKTATCELSLKGGQRIDGIVVDAAGTPIGGAAVETIAAATSGEEAHVVATTAADGTFALQQCSALLLVGARARGFAASQLFSVDGDAASKPLRIELRAVGGAVEGFVVGPDGAPIEGAVVRVGDGLREGVPSNDQGAPPLPAQAYSGADGRFLAVGVPPGAQPVMVRAGTNAPWRGIVEVPAGGTAAVQVTMTPGFTCRGTVLDPEGKPRGGVEVSVGKRGEFTRFEVKSATDGAFVLRGLPPGDVDVAANQHQVGKASQRVHGEPGADVRCDLALSAGGAVRGRVVDEGGQPLRAVEVTCETEAGQAYWYGRASTGADGRFVVIDCPADRTFRVIAAHADRVTWRRSGIDPRAGALEVTLPKDTSPRARIVGRLLLPDGNGAIGTRIEAFQQRPQTFAGATIRDAGGAFAIEVAQGAWALQVRAKGFPEIRREARELAAGAEWDVGTLQLAIGGTLVVHEPVMKASYLVIDAEERFVCGLYSPTPPHRSDLIAPGDYRLLVGGKGIAATVMPFTIAAERETTLTVKPAAGVEVPIQFVLPDGDPSRTVYYSVLQAGRLVAYGHTSGSANLLATSHLAPGDYELRTRERPRPTTVPLHVRAAAASTAPLVVTLQ